MKELSLNSKL